MFRTFRQEGAWVSSGAKRGNLQKHGAHGDGDVLQDKVTWAGVLGKT